MRTFLKELVALFVILFTVAVSRNMYVQLYDITSLVDPIDQIRIMPGLVRGVLLSIFAVLFVYALTRYWVWDKKSWKNVLVYTLFTFPVMYVSVISLGALLFILSLLTVTKTTFIQELTRLLASIIWFTIISLWIPFITARCAQGKNPWYSLYDAACDMYSKRALQVLLVYSLALSILILHIAANWNVLGTVPIFWGSYIFSRQFILSKKSTLKSYVVDICHNMHETGKTWYKKHIQG